jgi:hypothetical protein
MKNTFCPATTLHGSVALPFVIPSAAEGSAVLRTIPGNVFSTESHRLKTGGSAESVFKVTDHV